MCQLHFARPTQFCSRNALNKSPDLPSHISAPGGPSLKYDLSIHIYVSWGLHFQGHLIQQFNKNIIVWKKKYFWLFSQGLKFLIKSGTCLLPLQTFPLSYKQVLGLTVCQKICSGLILSGLTTLKLEQNICVSDISGLFFYWHRTAHVNQWLSSLRITKPFLTS